jgi:N-acetylmuramoyl-L-alanine amidase
MRKPIIVLDPGHGSTPSVRGYDPGVVYQGNIEARKALDLALTCKALLVQDGWDARLTHDGTQGAKPDLAERVRCAAGCGADVFVSIHFNSVPARPERSYGLVYFAPGAASLKLARRLAFECGFPADKVWASTSSRFNGLYIDAFPDPKPSVMWEVTGINKAPPEGDAGKAARIFEAQKLVRAVRHLKGGSL